jgi:membrane fusion protein (multidrug efflux system)
MGWEWWVISKRVAVWAAGSLAGLSIIALAACSKPPAGPPRGPPDVAVMTVRTAPVEVTTELPGRTSPFETSDVRPQVTGIIVARPFVEGSVVRAGQALFQIDPAPYRAALDQAKAQLASARAAVATAEAKADRYGDLAKINAVSRQDYDDAKAAALQAAAAVQQQQAAVEAATINLAYTRVTAPISGRIGRALLTKGALATAGQASALTTIQRLDPMYVDVTQSAAEVLALRQAQASGRLSGGGAGGVAVRLTLDDGSAYAHEGRLQFTDVTVDQASGTVTLRAVFPNPEGLLLPGLFVRARIIEGVDKAGMLVPQSAVSRDEKGQPTVLVADPQGRAQVRVLTTAGTVGDAWRVTSGLAAGDRLIVEGLQSARPGAPVHIVSSR